MDDADSSFLMLRMLGPMMSFVGLYGSILVTAPAILYVIARWRANREPTPDPHLGLKFALHYFAMIGLQLVLAGLAMVLYAGLADSPTDERWSLLRWGAGLLVPALAVFAAHVVILRFTNDALVPGVRRLFLGYNLLTTGFIGFVALVIGSEALFYKGSTGGVGRVAVAMLAIYGVAWGALAWAFGRLVLASPARGAAAAPPSAFVATEPLPLHRD